MNGKPSAVSLKSRKKKQNRVGKYVPVPPNPKWCACGSKKFITRSIKMANQEAILGCDSCAERAPLHAHVSRVQGAVVPKNYNPNFLKFNRDPQASHEASESEDSE